MRKLWILVVQTGFQSRHVWPRSYTLNHWAPLLPRGAGVGKGASSQSLDPLKCVHRDGRKEWLWRQQRGPERVLVKRGSWAWGPVGNMRKWVCASRFRDTTHQKRGHVICPLQVSQHLVLTLPPPLSLYHNLGYHHLNISENVFMGCLSSGLLSTVQTGQGRFQHRWSGPGNLQTSQCQETWTWEAERHPSSCLQASPHGFSLLSF